MKTNRPKKKASEVNFPDPDMYPVPSTEPAPSKYHRALNGYWMDIYDILDVYEIFNPADQHAIKKMIMPGDRGVKSAIQDRHEAILSLHRAIQLDSKKV